jgi:hypothetical protein
VGFGTSATLRPGALVDVTPRVIQFAFMRNANGIGACLFLEALAAGEIIDLTGGRTVV